MIDVTLLSIRDYFTQVNIRCTLKEKFLAISLDPVPIYLYIVNVEKPHAIFIQFRYLFPTHFKPEALCNLARYLHMVNQGLQFPGFGLIEADQTVYYRHDLYCNLDQVKEEILNGILGNIYLYIDTYGSDIKALSLCEKL